MPPDVRSRRYLLPGSPKTLSLSHNAVASRLEQDSEKAAAQPKTGKEPRLWTWDELPSWQRDNEHILTGYRLTSYSYLISLRSMTYIHNETGNIYTHLFATLWMLALALLALALLLRAYAGQHYSDHSTDDLVVFALFFAGGISCFSLSTSYHVFSNHSKGVSELCHKLDFLGIIFITSGCFLPGLWYTFPCIDRVTKMLLIGVSLNSGRLWKSGRDAQVKYMH